MVSLRIATLALMATACAQQAPSSGRMGAKFSAPFILIMEDSLGYMASTADMAAVWWNNETSLDLFTNDISREPTVVPILETDELDGPIAVTRWTTVLDEPWSLSIHVSTSMRRAHGMVRFRTMAHELGHVLGLGHAKDRRDVMYYTAVPDVPYISDEDVEWVRKEYSE